jgi:hypothetical protein
MTNKKNVITSYIQDNIGTVIMVICLILCAFVIIWIISIIYDTEKSTKNKSTNDQNDNATKMTVQ